MVKVGPTSMLNNTTCMLKYICHFYQTFQSNIHDVNMRQCFPDWTLLIFLAPKAQPRESWALLWEVTSCYGLICWSTTNWIRPWSVRSSRNSQLWATIYLNWQGPAEVKICLSGFRHYIIYHPDVNPPSTLNFLSCGLIWVCEDFFFLNATLSLGNPNLRSFRNFFVIGP